MFHIKLIGVDICPHRIVLKATDHVRRKFSKTLYKIKKKPIPWVMSISVPFSMIEMVEPVLL